MLGCFIVLHYKTYSCTCKCIESLLKLKGIDGCKIIVYDNGSQDNTAVQLKTRYVDKEIIEIHVGKREGFSHGNNHAYTIAKSYDPKFVVAINNDIEIHQKDFIAKLLKLINVQKYYVIGPDVYAPKFKEHQSPLYVNRPQERELEENEKFDIDIIRRPEKYIKKEEEQRHKIAKREKIPYIFFWLFRFVRSKFSGRYSDIDFFKYKEQHINPVFQGSIIIFTDKYIKENDKLFEPETNFFYEELLLSLKCERLNYRTIYTPELKAIHNHGISTNYAHSDIKDYLIFNSKNSFSSFEIYKKTLNGNRWKEE